METSSPKATKGRAKPVRVWIRETDSGYECCWPDTKDGRKHCDRPVEYVRLSRVKKLTLDEAMYERDGYGFCKPHWGMRNG